MKDLERYISGGVMNIHRHRILAEKQIEVIAIKVHLVRAI